METPYQPPSTDPENSDYPIIPSPSRKLAFIGVFLLSGPIIGKIITSNLNKSNDILHPSL